MSEPRRAVAVFGSVPFSAPWLTEHNLAAALGRRAPVAWVDPPRSPLTRRRDGAMTRPNGLSVRRPVVLPPIERPLAQRLSAPLLGLQLGSLRRRHPLAVFARGPAATVGLVRPSRSAYLVKDWIPAGAALIGRTEAELEHEVLSMCRRVDVVCAVTERLRQTLGDRGITSRLLRHGFAAETAPAFDGAAEPADLQRLPRPRLGYVGRIDDRLDFDALRAIAARHPGGTVVLVGPVSPRLAASSAEALRSRPNLVLLGSRSRDALPGYLAHFDCFLLPYRPGRWGEHGSPLKLWEYLYAGAPIVGSGYEVLREYGEFVTYVAPQDLADTTVEALGAGSPADAERRRRFALENTWDHRVDELLEIVAQDTAG